MLQIGGAVDVAAIIITSYVVYASGPMWLLMVGLVLWGIVNTTTYGPSQALYADSVPTGDRSKYVPYFLCQGSHPSNLSIPYRYGVVALHDYHQRHDISALPLILKRRHVHGAGTDK